MTSPVWQLGCFAPTDTDMHACNTSHSSPQASCNMILLPVQILVIHWLTLIAPGAYPDTALPDGMLCTVAVLPL